MRMQTKVIVFGATYLLGFVPVAVLLNAAFPGQIGYIQIVGLLWFLVFGVAQFYLFKCPHCGGRSVVRPNGAPSLAVGSACPHCQKEY
jgi:hypothetical protein